MKQEAQMGEIITSELPLLTGKFRMPFVRRGASAVYNVWVRGGSCGL